MERPAKPRLGRSVRTEGDPDWYRDAVVYEVHVRAFRDSTNDGVGDFGGLREKLDYLEQLGVTALWLLPFYPSPLRDDGYDISDYLGVHPSYGTRRDFRAFLDDAHRRGIRVITELVLNHTSDRHPWFQRARRAKPGSPWRDFYVWSDTADRYREARVIFKDFEGANWSWDAEARAYYWHRFYSHQPDLNYSSASVRRAMTRVMDFWLAQGVDGLRLDAVPYLYERDGTTCENLPETHAFLKDLRRHVDTRFRDRVLVAEANQWAEDAITYFGEGDECHMAFHFPLMPRLFMALRTEERFPIVEILRRTPHIPPSCQWALFLRNHDELTLEMVTDEERDYMYRVYAHDQQARVNLGIRRRLAPLLGNNRRKIELIHGLLFSLPGTPVLYYGDEIGMGDNIYLGDRDSVRTPMQWSGGLNAGFSSANPQRLFLPPIVDPEFHYAAVNVEAQEANPQSLLWWTRRLIALRKRHRAFGRGSIEFLYPENRKVLTFLRRHDDEVLLVVANLSRFVQPVAIPLPAFPGWTPVELFGRTRFPSLGPGPLFLTLGPHSFYWFSLEPARTESAGAADSTPAGPPEIRVPGGTPPALDGPVRAGIGDVLPALLRRRPWFAGGTRAIRVARAVELVRVPVPGSEAAGILLARVEYAEGEPETYSVPVALLATDAAVSALEARHPEAILARLRRPDGGDWLLVEGSYHVAFARALLSAFARRRRWRGDRGELVATSGPAERRLVGTPPGPDPEPLVAGRGHAPIRFGDRLLLRLFGRVETGPSPEPEVSRVLAAHAATRAFPRVVGTLEYRTSDGAAAGLGVLETWVPNEGDAWQYTLDALGRYYERILAPGSLQPLPRPSPSLAEAAATGPSETAVEALGTYASSAGRIGEAVAEMHMALASEREDPAFRPEPFDPYYRRALFHAMRMRADRAFLSLRRAAAALPEAAREDAERLLRCEDKVDLKLQAFLGQEVTGARIRIHGDLGLPKLLATGRGFVAFDFGGDPRRSLGERRIKRSALRDLAGIVRSLHAAAHAAATDLVERGSISGHPSARATLDAATAYWRDWAGVAVLHGYREATRGASFLPSSVEDWRAGLDAHLLDLWVEELEEATERAPAQAARVVRALLDLLAGGA